MYKNVRFSEEECELQGTLFILHRLKVNDLRHSSEESKRTTLQLTHIFLHYFYAFEAKRKRKKEKKNTH